MLLLFVRIVEESFCKTLFFTSLRKNSYKQISWWSFRSLSSMLLCLSEMAACKHNCRKTEFFVLFVTSVFSLQVGYGNGTISFFKARLLGNNFISRKQCWENGGECSYRQMQHRLEYEVLEKGGSEIQASAIRSSINAWMQQAGEEDVSRWCLRLWAGGSYTEQLGAGLLFFWTDLEFITCFVLVAGAWTRLGLCLTVMGQKGFNWLHAPGWLNFPLLRQWVDGFAT